MRTTLSPKQGNRCQNKFVGVKRIEVRGQLGIYDWTDYAAIVFDEPLGGGGGAYMRYILAGCEKRRNSRRKLTSNLVLSAIILWNPIPTPSITAKKQAHIMAEFRAALIPPRIASAPPVKNPAITNNNSLVHESQMML